MRPTRFIPFCLSAFCIIAAEQASAQNAPTSRSPGKKAEVESMLPQAGNASKKKKHKKGIFSPSRQSGFKKGDVKHSARYEFYERIEQAAKEKQRILKKLAKAQYSDPRYFGHKRIPKRRPPHKMRYCGECGIRH